MKPQETIDLATREMAMAMREGHRFTADVLHDCIQVMEWQQRRLKERTDAASPPQEEK